MARVARETAAGDGAQARGRIGRGARRAARTLDVALLSRGPPGRRDARGRASARTPPSTIASMPRSCDVCTVGAEPDALIGPACCADARCRHGRPSSRFWSDRGPRARDRLPASMEDWSVRDLVYHVGRLVRARLREANDLAAHGRPASVRVLANAKTDAMNASHLAGRPRRLLRSMRSRARRAPTRASARDGRSRRGIARLSRSATATRSRKSSRYDGPEHYAEHTAHLRSWFGTDADDGPTRKARSRR